MNVLIVYAHPEPRSLNGAIRDFSVERLRRAGHEVQLSDLYAMRWKATFDAADFLDRDPNEPLDPEGASKHAYETGTQTPDIAAEVPVPLRTTSIINRRTVCATSLVVTRCTEGSLSGVKVGCGRRPPGRQIG